MDDGGDAEFYRASGGSIKSVYSLASPIDYNTIYRTSIYMYDGNLYLRKTNRKVRTEHMLLFSDEMDVMDRAPKIFSQVFQNFFFSFLYSSASSFCFSFFFPFSTFSPDRRGLDRWAICHELVRMGALGPALLLSLKEQPPGDRVIE